MGYFSNVFIPGLDCALDKSKAYADEKVNELGEQYCAGYYDGACDMLRRLVSDLTVDQVHITLEDGLHYVEFSPKE